MQKTLKPAFEQLLKLVFGKKVWEPGRRYHIGQIRSLRHSKDGLIDLSEKLNAEIISKYKPHQGKREMKRRIQQMEKLNVKSRKSGTQAESN